MHLRDISKMLVPELLETRKRLAEDMSETERRLCEIEQEIVLRYKSAKITTVTCDHPVTRYLGKYMGRIINQCQCCDKKIVKY